MSGLDLESCRILEVAAIVTDVKMKELASYEAIVRQDQSVLDAMDKWCTRQHAESGLTAKVPDGTPEDQVETAVLGLINTHWKRGDTAVLCGNSIATDRDFIRKYWPRVAKRLHYRLLDVSSFKVILKARHGVNFEKTGNHRALDDVRESMAELQYYMSLFDPEKLPVS